MSCKETEPLWLQLALKAIEVVDLYQQTKMVTELDGHIMKCACDKNGNHVIQKMYRMCYRKDIKLLLPDLIYMHITEGNRGG